MAAKAAESKNQRRRAAKKAKKEQGEQPAPTETSTDEKGETTVEVNGHVEPTSKAPSNLDDLDDLDSIEKDHFLYEQFKDVIDRFNDADKEDPSEKEIDKPEVYFGDDDDVVPDEEEDVQPKMGKKKRKEASKLSIAELKALVSKPELVEWTDVSSQDPRLLVSLKAHKNIVPVPNHWSLKREYLSSKRGVEKPPFALPKFIQETGIAEMRDAVLEKQAEQTLKQRQRERVQGKTGKLDIDYTRLYNAFFKFQTKPELTRYGEIYYEGKEYETNLKHLKPGELSEELKDALNIPPGAPPPWLVNQQRFGPPPSYPALKIPGLNAPPPPHGAWGFHPGGYGKPPVDEYNRPLYGGDVFGTAVANQPYYVGEPVVKSIWGEMQEEDEEEEEQEEEEEEEDEEEADPDDEEMAAGMETVGGKRASGIASVDASVYGGTESVQGDFTLRKTRRGTETEETVHPRSAHQVIPEQAAQSKGFFGSDRKYDLSGSRGNEHLPVLGEENNPRKRKAGDLDVSVDMEALQRDDKLSKDEIRRQYEAQQKAQRQQNPWEHGESLDDMIAEEARKRLKKDEERRSKR